MNDLVAAVRAILEPLPTPPDEPLVAIDETCAKPFSYKPRTLYLYPTRVVETAFESGTARRQDFTLVAEVTAADEGEEPDLERKTTVSEFLDDRREAYFAAIRDNQVSSDWLYLRAAEEGPGPATLEHRSLALRLTGYRFVGG